MRISTDGTPQGTRLFDEHGDLLANVVAVRREGRNVFVTTRFRDVEVLGVEGDFEICVKGRRL